MARIRQIPPQSIAAQITVLEKYFPSGVVTSRSISHLVWCCDITPTPNSLTYRIKIDYKLGERPYTYVISPKKLAMPEGESALPHIFNQETQSICLFHTPSGDWAPYMFLAKTIVPWASEWLLYYELWLATGEWLGEGIHPRSHHEKK